VGEASNNDKVLPVRSLVSCRINSQSTVSTLSVWSEFPDDDETVTVASSSRTTRSTHRIERFRASLTDSDKGLGNAPNRKGSRHSVVSPLDSHEGCNLAPKIPTRQDTADRQVFQDAIQDDTPHRPRLNRLSGGINVFKRTLN
jgi:hypothetical protein